MRIQKKYLTSEVSVLSIVNFKTQCIVHLCHNFKVEGWKRKAAGKLAGGNAIL